MTSSIEAIFNEKLDLVTIPKREYYRLLEYKEICKEFHAIMSDNGGESL